MDRGAGIQFNKRGGRQTRPDRAGRIASSKPMPYDKRG
jgi:hypothetical protein